MSGKKEEKHHQKETFNFKALEEEIKKEMEKVLTHFREEIKKVKTGKASIGLLEDVKVDYYGTTVTLQQISALRVADPHTIIVEPWDKNAIKNIEKAIVQLGLGFGVSSDSNVVRVHIPPLTEETKQEYVRHLHKIAESARVGIRNVRHEYHNTLRDKKRDGIISEDEEKRYQQELEKITHEFINKVDELTKMKEKEIMEV